MRTLFKLAFIPLLAFLSVSCSQNVTAINDSDGLYSSSPNRSPTTYGSRVEYVNHSELWIFKKQSSNSNKLGELHLGDSIMVLTRLNNGWAKVQWGEETAYANQMYLVSKSEFESEYGSTYVPTSGNHTYIKGPKGGCYYLSDNGTKVYVSRTLCGDSPSTSSPTYVGPKGGTYHYTKSGKKSYNKPKK